MQLELKKHLADARAAVGRIESFTAGTDLEAYLGDELLRAGVERQFLIIGEALVRIRSAAPEALDRITDSKRIIRFRNVLVHGYDVVSHETVWEVVMQHLPALKRELDTLLTS
jgi:uncharacterized protein with HEPN domain